MTFDFTPGGDACFNKNFGAHHKQSSIRYPSPYNKYLLYILHIEFIIIISSIFLYAILNK